MRVGGTDAWLEIVPEEVDELSVGIRVRVSARWRSFEGAESVWIVTDEWLRFLAEVEQFERTLKGEANVEGMSPGELRLRFFPLDPAGHPGVEGEIGFRGFSGDFAHRLNTFSFRFSAIEIDPATFHRWVAWLRDRTKL